MATIIVFDLDDTLYPERQFALSGFRSCARWARDELGHADDAGLVAQMTALLDQGLLGKLFPIALASVRPAHTPAELKAFVEAYRDHEPELALHADGAWAVEHYAAQGPLGLITDGSHRVQQSKVRALGIADRFAEIVYTGALGPDRAFSKPHPLAFERIAAALGGPGDQYVYVGDNPAKDFVAPNALGWTSVWVTRPGGIHDGASVAYGGAPRHTVAALTELPAILGR